MTDAMLGLKRRVTRLRYGSNGLIIVHHLYFLEKALKIIYFNSFVSFY